MTSMTEGLKPLTALSTGQRAVLRQLNVEPANRPRLMEMGLISGTTVELVRFAPMGDPVEIKVRGYHLTLRRHEADMLFVETV